MHFYFKSKMPEKLIISYKFYTLIKENLIKCLYMWFKYLLLYRFRKLIQKKNGELAHLARALDWQSKGDGFDPRILHNLFIKQKL